MNKYSLEGELALRIKALIKQNPKLVEGQNLRIVASAAGFRTISQLRRWLGEVNNVSKSG